ncbi:MAG: ECF-type sigma factor [Planctomycetota bacterium]
MPSSPDLTGLLLRFQQGDADAANELVPLVHQELHRLARRALSRLPAGQTLQTTALLNEAWMRIDRGPEGGPGGEIHDREHFLAIAAKAMRAVVVDRARSRTAEKRGGAFRRIDLDEVVDMLEHGATDVVALDEALEELAAERPELARVVELRFFAGMKHPEIARVEGLPLRRVERSWQAARAWLFVRLSDPDAAGAEGDGA